MRWNKALTAAFLPQTTGGEEIVCAKIQIVDYGSG
jgi:hypothetical protein